MPELLPGAPSFRNFGDAPTTRKLIFDNVFKAATALKPVQNQRHTLQLADVAYEGPEEYSKQDVKRAVLSGTSLTRRLRGTWQLSDNATGKSIAERRATLANVPYLIDDGLFINRGVGYTLAHQLRLAPGIFARKKQNGELEAHVNVLPGKGRGHRIFMDPESGVFKLNMAQANMPLYPLLRAMGATDQQLRDTWGNDLAGINAAKADNTVIRKLYDRVARNRVEGADPEVMAKAVAESFGGMELDDFVTNRTLKHKSTRLDLPTILATTKKLLDINRGEAEPDDRDHMAYQHVLGPENLLAERLEKSGGELRKLLWKVSARQNLDGVQPGFFDRAIQSAIIGSGLGAPIEEINPAEIFDQQSRLTRMGEGGISSLDAVPEESRAVQPTHLGFVDFLRTPESGKVGVDMRLARKAVKGDDGFLYFPLQNAKSGQTEYKSARDLADSVIAFEPVPQAPVNPNGPEPPAKKFWGGDGRKTGPVQYGGNTFVNVLAGGKMRYERADKVDYVLPAIEDTFSPLANLIPLKSMVKGQRAVMAARMVTQALPLQDGEAPLVQSAMPENAERSFEEEYAKHMGAVHADQPASVVSVDRNGIVLKHADGSKKRVDLYDNMPYNRKSVTGRTRVLIRRNGGYWEGPISEYVAHAGDDVLSVDPLTKKSKWCRITGFIRHDNDKRLVRVRTASGRAVDITIDHSLVTLDAAGNLSPIFPADVVINRTRLPVAMVPCDGDAQVSTDLASLAGLYLAEGHLPEQAGLVKIAVEPDIRAAQILELLQRLGTSPYRVGGEVCFTSHELRAWLLTNFGCTSGGKFISPEVLTWQSDARSCLLSGYFAGDGCLWADAGGAIQVQAVSTSRRLRDGLVTLAASLQIFSTLFDAPRQHLNDNWNDAYGFRIISSHLSRLSRWFFYDDREQLFRELLRRAYRASPYDMVPIVSKLARKSLYAELPQSSNYVYKTAGKGAVAKHRLVAGTGNFGKWGASDVMWDTVVAVEAIPHEAHVYDFCVAESEVFGVDHGLIVHNTLITQTAVVKPGDVVQPGQLLARSNFTDGQGVTALGKNLRVAYLPFRGANFEDANVISESAAKRLSSEHAYQHVAEWGPDVRRGKNAFLSNFPGRFHRAVLDQFTDDGVVKPGTEIRYGDPLVLSITERERTHGAIHRGRRPEVIDSSITWDHHAPGTVTDVVNTDKGATVVVKATVPSEVGDKLSGRYGDKGVISMIVPDDEMPTDAQGKPYEILTNPLGVISRVNAAQMIEAALGKVAAVTGKPYKVPFRTATDAVEFAMSELRKHNLSDLDSVIDPETGKKIPNVFAGNRWFMKLHHTSEAKAQGRGIGGYTSEGAPAKGGESGAKRIGMLNLGALLSHGAGKVIREAKMIRGQANPEFWSQFMSGYQPTTPRIPKTYEKFIGMLQGAGIHPVKDGTRTQLMAMSPAKVDELTGGREIQNTETVDWKNGLKPKRGGLFDEAITGGHEGTRWSAIRLHEPMPNPVMEEPIRRVLGLTENKMRDVLAGRESLHGVSGPQGIVKALSNIDLDREIEQTRLSLKSARKTQRDEAIRKFGFLTAAARTGVHPKDWIMGKVPVLPPRFRPVTTMGQKKLPLVADANYLYKELFDANDVLKQMSDKVDDVGDERLAMYDAMKAVSGLGEPQHPKNQERGVKGLLKQIFGSSPKFGMIQRKLLSTTTDLVGRATITPNPDLDMDSVGLPEEKAWELYTPYTVRHLVRRGMPRLQAAQLVKNKHPVAREALVSEMGQRPVMIDRAPVLHRYGVMAFWPKITKGHTMQISPLVVGGFNADFDGDAMQFHLPADDEAAKEMAEKMLPSKNLFSVAKFRTHYLPSQEYVGGMYHLTSRIDTHNRPTVFETPADALRAYERGEIDGSRRIKIMRP